MSCFSLSITYVLIIVRSPMTDFSLIEYDDGVLIVHCFEQHVSSFNSNICSVVINNVTVKIEYVKRIKTLCISV